MGNQLWIDHAPNVSATIIVLGVLSLMVLPLRFYTRLRNAVWGLDDSCMAFAIIPFTALTVACLAGSFRGIGVHESHLTEAEQREGLKWFFLFECFYCSSIVPIKLSISFMLMRIASPRQSYVKSLYVVSALFTIMNIISLLYIIFRCNPVSYAWDTTSKGGSCQAADILADIYYADTAINIVTDWFCAILPVPLLWNVQLNRNAKLSVAILLSLGALASLSACIRLNYTINLTNSDDYLYGVGDVVIWGYAENGVGLIVACISTLRPLFRRAFHLGGTSTPAQGSKRSPWPTERNRREYLEFESGIELPSHMRPDKVNAIATVKVGQSRRSSSACDSESEEHILGTSRGIQVERSVLQDVSYN